MGEVEGEELRDIVAEFGLDAAVPRLPLVVDSSLPKRHFSLPPSLFSATTDSVVVGFRGSAFFFILSSGFTTSLNLFINLLKFNQLIKILIIYPLIKRPFGQTTDFLFIYLFFFGLKGKKK